MKTGIYISRLLLC